MQWLPNFNGDTVKYLFFCQTEGPGNVNHTDQQPYVTFSKYCILW